MKRFALILILIMMTCLLIGCTTPETGGDDPAGVVNGENGQDPGTVGDATPTPTPEITPVPTVTPREVAMAVQSAAPGTTPLLIDPVDKPTKTPVTFKFEDYESIVLGISFNRPAGWAESTPYENAVQFIEPESEAHDGVPARLIVQVTNFSTNQTADDAKNELNRLVDAMREEYPDIGVGVVGENKMLGETGYYVNIRFTQADGSILRGRIFVLAKNRILYHVRYIAPANYNSDYEEVYRKVRNTLSEL